MEPLSEDMNKQTYLEEILIKEVENTPVLWDKNHKDYKNRAAMEREWERIGTVVLNKNKDFVKQKWRNLRDQFTREIKKVKVPYGNPTKPYIDYYRGKWIYFQQMLFLRDTSSIKTSICYSPAHDIDIHEEDIIKKERLIFEDEMYAKVDMYPEQANVNSNKSDNYKKDLSDTYPSVEDSKNTFNNLPIQPVKIEVLDEDELEDASAVKRHAAENSSELPIPAKMKKPSVVDAASNTEHIGVNYEGNEEIDDDLHFVKSLVPYLRKLNPIRKLLVRNEIQSLLIRESLCENCKFGKGSSLQS